MARRRSRWASEAALQALVRYGPEESGLRAMEHEARSQYRSATRAARGSAEAITSEVDRARPEVAHLYDRAGLAAARSAHAVVDPVLEGLGSSAQSLVGAAKIEQAGFQQRLRESKAGALTDLADRRVQAVEGAQFATQRARSDFVNTLEKILQRHQDLRREKGAYTASTAQTLHEAARERAQQLDIAQMGAETSRQNSRRSARQSERNSLRTAGINPDTGEPIPGGKLDPKAQARERAKKKWATPAAQTRARQDFSAALDYARTFAQHGAKRSDAAATLKNGLEAQPIYETDAAGHQKRKLNPDGTPAMTDSAPQIKDQLLLSAALDMAYDGHLSRRTQQLLHENGIKIGPLGATTYEQWRRRRGALSRPPLAAGPSGQQRPT